MEIGEFQSLLKGCDSDATLIDLCRRTIIHGTPAIFSGREDDFYSFRNRIAKTFDVDFHEVYIVGSAKIGFSPFKKYKKFDLDSDIDVAIVSNRLFETIMDKIRIFQMEIRASRRQITRHEIDNYHKFLEYTALGWIRPDKLPMSVQIRELKSNWFDFFNSISYGKSEVGNYKVNAGAFKGYRHLELYTLDGIKKVKNSLPMEA